VNVKQRARIARMRGQLEDVTYFDRQANRRSSILQQTLWDEDDGFFYDRDVRTGNRLS